MPSIDGQSDAEDSPASLTPVSVHRTTPNRLVFTEEGNSDGWIATDVSTEIER